MKTQKIVLALALVAVTPAVLAAQDYVGGPGSKMSYIADNALERIRQNHKESNTQDQNPVKNQQTVEPQQTVQQTKTANTTPAYYPYSWSEGHMLVRENLKKPKTDTVKYKSTGSYQYTGPEGHRAAIGNAKRDAKHEKYEPKSVPSHVKDIDTIATNHQVTLDNKKAEKSAKKTNKTFRNYLSEIAQAIAQEAPYMK